MSKEIDTKDLTEAVEDLTREHPSLPQRLGQYRDKRLAYEAKRMARRATTTAPTKDARRTLRG